MMKNFDLDKLCRHCANNNEKERIKTCYIPDSETKSCIQYISIFQCGKSQCKKCKRCQEDESN